MKSRLAPKIIALTLALCLSLAPAAYALTPAQLRELLGAFYLDEISDAVLAEDSVEGILKLLDDPYTDYLSAAEYQELLASLEDQEIAGIGCSLSLTEEGLLLSEVFANSPAATLGLKAGDSIIAVDGESVLTLGSDLAVARLRGEIDSLVRLRVLHADGSEQDYETKRALVIVPSTSYESPEDGLGYINCRTFGSDTLAHFLDAAKALAQSKNLIVDLRTNPGGDLDAVAQVLGVFLGEGEIVYLRDGRDEYRVHSSQQSKQLSQPTIILTSGLTASASEIFSAVMRDRDTGLLVGETTYGKGVAQSLLDGTYFPEYFPAGDALKVTSYRYFTKIGNTADHIGVIPHLMVSAYDAADVARLLSEPAPTQGDLRDYLRLQIDSFTGYLSLKQATADEQRYYFIQLLQALPPKATIERGTAQGQWLSSSVAQLVTELGLTEYQSRSLIDLEGHPNQSELNTLATYSLLRGDAARNYKPAASMTRAELCALLVQAFGLRESKAPVAFSDVTSGAWYEDAVQAAVAAGLMQGVGSGRFAPAEQLTQEQLISVLGRAAARVNSVLYEEAKTYTNQNSSALAAISPWARQWTWLLALSQESDYGETVNLLWDELSTLSPTSPATRAQAGVLLYRILAYTNILPS